jgi:hypothetical protein
MRKIFFLNPENHLDFYHPRNYKDHLKLTNSIGSIQEISKEFSLHFYWKNFNIEFNKKHALSLKSAIISQNLSKCKIKLWSDKDITKNEHLKPLLKYIDFEIWDMEKQLRYFGLEKLLEPLEKDFGWLTSDIFRILCLGLYGGIYIDLDNFILKDLSPLSDYEFSYYGGTPPEIHQWIGVMGMDKNSIFFNKLLYNIKNLEIIRPNAEDLGRFLLLKTRNNFKEYSIFPTIWFDEDFVNGALHPEGFSFTNNFKKNKNKFINPTVFTWHWHNHWDIREEHGSKFFDYKERTEKLFNDKFNNINFVFFPRVNKKIYCWWLNKTEMNPIRKIGYESIVKNSGVEVELITLDNLNKYILKDHPLHEGFQYLSAVHKSDYLRSYFMHFYGGGHCDIKQLKYSWAESFEKLERHSDKIGITSSAVHGSYINNPNLNQFLNKNLHKLTAKNVFIFKKNTSFTLEWYKTTQMIMDSILENLKKYPAQYNRDRKLSEYGRNGTIADFGPKGQSFFREDYFYPLGWEELHADFFYPLIYKYRDQILLGLPQQELHLDYGGEVTKETL